MNPRLRQHQRCALRKSRRPRCHKWSAHLSRFRRRLAGRKRRGRPLSASRTVDGARQGESSGMRHSQSTHNELDCRQWESFPAVVRWSCSVMLWVVDRSGAMPLSDQGHWETNGVTEVVFSYAVSYRTCPLSRCLTPLGTTTLSKPDNFNPELPENSPTPNSWLTARCRPRLPPPRSPPAYRHR